MRTDGEAALEGDDHDLCLLDASTGEELDGSRYVAWASERTLQDYRGLAVVAPVEWVDDMDVVRYWDRQLNGYGEPSTCYDGLRWLDQWFLWNGVLKGPEWLPTSDGALVYCVQWADDDYLSPGSYAPGSRDPEMPYDYATVPVVNNTYAGWSYILAGDRYLSRHGINDLFPPPVEVSLFDQGKAHIAVGGNIWVTERRHVISYEVNRYTANSTICPLEAYEECAYWYFGPPGTDDPNYIPGHVFQPTTAAGVYPFSFNHTGVGPMLTPYGNATLSGVLCVVKGSVTVSDPIPRKPNAPAASVSYSVGPAETSLAAVAEPVVVEIWDPTSPCFRKKWGFAAHSGSVQWSGLLDRYASPDAPEPIEQDVAYCQASAVFSRIRVVVEDHFWNNIIKTENRTFSFDQPGLAFAGPETGYIGQKRNYVQVWIQGTKESEIHWNGGDTPPELTAATYSTRFFSSGQKTVFASAWVRTDGAAVLKWSSWVTNVKDIFCYGDGGKEYSGIYPDNPSFGVYASNLVSGSAWDTNYVNLDQNGDPQSAKFNVGWVGKFKGDLSHKANTLRNCRWENQANPELTTPWNMAGNDNLTEFNWKGFMPEIVTQNDYAANGNRDVKFNLANCHGNCAHCFGVMSLNLATHEVAGGLEALGATFTEDLNKPIGDVMLWIKAGGIIFFDSPDPRMQGASHSAYVVSVGPNTSQTWIWACNAGVSSAGTKGGFDEVTLQGYLNEHSVSIVSLYNDIE